jgi:hypothetical protein
VQPHERHCAYSFLHRFGVEKHVRRQARSVIFRSPLATKCSILRPAEYEEIGTMPREKDDQYEARRRQVFDRPDERNYRTAQAARDTENASGAGTKRDVRPSSGGIAGVRFLLSAEAVVHDLLNLSEIRDPERWLKRHGAPVAMDTRQCKRYLAPDVLRWAAAKFAPTAKSQAALLALAENIQAAERRALNSPDSTGGTVS